MSLRNVDKRNVLIIIMALSLTVIMGAVLLKTKACASLQQPSTKMLVVHEKPSGPVDLSTAIIKVARQNIPAVVYIQVKLSKTVENPLFPFQNDPFFRRFFGIPKMPPRFRQEITGVGSGMILDQGGHILTNSHVVTNATEMIVMLADGTRHNAQVVGSDPKTDLAVIRLTPAPKDLHNVVFGDSDKVEVGEWVVAIGAPQAIQKSVTQGIISGMHRTGISEPTDYQDFLQTDAPINPGNSGGPLLNLYGQVIGVNAAIATASGGFEGIGFTIPSNIAVYVAKALIQSGKIERGWLGVTIRDVTPEEARASGKAPAGSVIENVVKGGPAERAGLTKGDVVVAFDGKEITDTNDLRNRVSQTTPGTVVTLTVVRNGKRQNIKVTTGTEKDAAQAISISLKARLGATFRPLTEAEVQKYGLKEGLGVIVTSVERGGPLAQAGFEVGDGILVINDEPVAGVEGLALVLETLKPRQKVSVVALDHRSGEKGKITVTVR